MESSQPTIASQPSTQDCAGKAPVTDRSLQPPKLTFTPPTPGIRHGSFSEGKAQMPRPSPLMLVDGDHNMPDMDRFPPGDVGVRTRRTQSKSKQPNMGKQRSTYFEHAFSAKDDNPVKARVRSEAIVMADVKTNVIITDEFTFITELSYQLSSRYQRPISSIVVTLNHGACMLFGGTFDPAYVMSVFALPSQLQPTTNKRNAALIQKHMEEAIGVDPARGLLRFIPTQEEHTAWNGKTLAGEIDDLEKDSGIPTAAEETAVGTAGVDRRKSKPKKRAFGSGKTTQETTAQTKETTSPASAQNTETSPVTLTRGGDQLPVSVKMPKRTKSLMALVFGGR